MNVKINKDKRITIVIKKDTHDRLVQIGKYSDTLDDIVSRLLDVVEKEIPNVQKDIEFLKSHIH